MSFQYVVFLPSLASFCTAFLKHFMVEVNTLGPPHVIKLRLGLSKGMLPVRYFCSNNSSLCQFKLVKVKSFHKIEVNLATIRFWSINGFKAMVSVYVYDHVA